MFIKKVRDYAHNAHRKLNGVGVGQDSNVSQKVMTHSQETVQPISTHHPYFCWPTAQQNNLDS